MAKRKVIWSIHASMDMLEIMNYYTNRNKSTEYSQKLYKSIQVKLNKLDFSITLPQKTADKKLFYFTHNHIFVGFDFHNNDLDIVLVIDSRRSPELINKLVNSFT